MWCILGCLTAPCSSTLSVGTINFGGSIIVNEGINNNVTMITDSIIVPLIFPEAKINESLDSFINNIEKLKTKILQKNKILENLGIIANKQRSIISSFLRNYKTQSRSKRQVGLIAEGLASVLGFGINQWQIQHINDMVNDLKVRKFTQR